jgi:hypothetical protein
MKAPNRRGFLIAKIVIAENVKQRCVIAMFQGGEVLRRQVSAGQNQFNVGNGRTASDRFKQVFDDGICDTEDFHNLAGFSDRRVPCRTL